MKKMLTLMVACGAVASQAQIFPVGPFATVAPWIDGYDTLAPGAYLGFPMFAGNGGAARIQPMNALLVGNIGGAALTPPNYMFGRGTDVQIRINQPARAFGGYFMQAPAGIAVTQIKFAFYDQFNIFIGSIAVPCPAAWSWIGFRTIPNWQRVEIYGNGILPGYVAMDQTRVRI